jgi:hypothetical protein
MPHARASVRRVVSDAARVEPPHEPALDHLDRSVGVEGYPERPPEVATGAQGHHGEPGGGRNRGAVAEETVDDLVQGAVAADRDHDRARLPDRALGDVDRLEGSGGHGRLEMNAGRGQPGLHRRPVAAGLAAARRRVDDEEDRRAGLAAYGAPPAAFRFMMPIGSIPSLTACQTFIHPPISAATQRART